MYLTFRWSAGVANPESFDPGSDRSYESNPTLPIPKLQLRGWRRAGFLQRMPLCRSVWLGTVVLLRVPNFGAAKNPHACWWPSAGNCRSLIDMTTWTSRVAVIRWSRPSLFAVGGWSEGVGIPCHNRGRVQTRSATNSVGCWALKGGPSPRACQHIAWHSCSMSSDYGAR